MIDRNARSTRQETMTQEPMTQEPKTTSPNDLLTPEEVETEYRICRTVLTEWRAKRINLDFIKPHRKVYYRRSVVEAYLLSRTVTVRQAS